MIPILADHNDGLYTSYGWLFPAVVNNNYIICHFFSHYLVQYIPKQPKGKTLYFFSIKAWTKSPAGITMRHALTSYYNSPQFLYKHYPKFNYTSPIPSILCTDAFQSMYAQILVGLADRLAIVCVGSGFAPSLIHAIRLLELHYEDLAADIEHGTVNPQITDPAVREALENILVPDPDNATHIRRECSSGDWQGIIKRIWPNTKFLEIVVTGAMAQYIPRFNFYSGNLPLVNNLYGSSECVFGLNLNPFNKPEDVAYTIMPNLAFFEFLPIMPADDINHMVQQEPVDLAHVEVGKEYEIMVTTYSGLYRYKVGDILRVVKFYNKAPEFQIVGRRNVCLSIDMDKTEETDVQKAIAAAELTHLVPHNIKVLDYTCYSDVKKLPGHYIIYFELSPTNHIESYLLSQAIDRCCFTIEESLSSVYRSLRAYYKRIDPLEIKLVKSGTFHELMEHAVSRGASAAQYKPPKCVKSAWILEKLEAKVVSAHFSPSAPSWSPPSPQKGS
ncbi:unnamed protein product [Victoria cruziana]